MVRLENYINGELHPPVSNKYIDNFEPATGTVYSQIPRSDKDDVAKAVEAARNAFKDWSEMSADRRSKYLRAISDRINVQMEELAAAESRDNGKPQWLAMEVDIPRARDNFAFFASAIKHFDSESHLTRKGVINYTLRKAIGVAGCISPWNLPLYLFTWKIAPALAAGNTVVAKPSEVTPMTAYMLSKICIDVGLPAGVLNIVHGLGGEAGNEIVQHDDVKMISFTGGTTTGAHIASVAAPKFKKLSLELGGKNPNIIFDDCNFEKAMETTMRSSFRNQGQICLCGSRIYIQSGIYEKFRDEFVRRTSEMVVGQPNDPKSQMGAIVSKQHYDKILSYIELAKDEGGTILTGGESVDVGGKFADGWYIRPTIIEGLNETCRTNQEEIFGPVVTLQPFDTEEEVMMLANSTGYGLASTIWTENLSRAHRMADEIQAGIVWINCWLLRDLRTPFGGMKNSGVGREGGWEALRFFTEPKNVCIDFSS